MMNKNTRIILLCFSGLFIGTSVVLHILTRQLYGLLTWNIIYIEIGAMISDIIATTVFLSWLWFMYMQKKNLPINEERK